MTEEEWSRRLAAHIGRRVAYFREKAGRMTAQELADRCAELGHPLDRSVIAKLEKGYRHTVTVADLIVIAKALGVPPALLVYPLGVEPTVEVLPGTRRRTWDALRWFTGAAAFPAEDAEPTVNPLRVGTRADAQVWVAGRAPITWYEDHDQHVANWHWEYNRIPILEEAVETAPTDQRRQHAQEELPKVHERLAKMERVLMDVRQKLRTRGIVPPPLPPALRNALPEPDFAVYEYTDQAGKVVRRRTVDAGSENDYRLAGSPDWHHVEGVPFRERPEDFDLTEQGREERE